MSQRETSPLNTETVNSVSKNDEKLKFQRQNSDNRLGSAFTRGMTRNKTEASLMTARNRLENKFSKPSEPAESQFTHYTRRTRGTSKPSASSKTRAASRYDSTNKVTTKEISEYNTTNMQKKAAVQVENASRHGPVNAQKVLISKYVDYSSKYGIGYKLSNGSYGVLYNDSTKMLLNENLYDFIYIRRESSSQKELLDSLINHYDFGNYPPSLKKKVILLQHFKSYLDGVKFEAPTKAPFPKTDYEEIFLKKWKRAKKAILFRLSNKVIQVIFQDSSELILSSGSGNVTFVTAKEEVRSTPLYSDLENKDPSLFKRLNYAKEILVHMIHPEKAMPTHGNEKENRDGASTTRAKDHNLFVKIGDVESAHRPDYRISGLVSSRANKINKFSAVIDTRPIV